MKNYSQFAKEHLLISRGKGVSILDYEAFLSDVQLHFPNHLFYPEIENGLHYSELYEKLKQIINSPYPSIITTYSMDAIEFFSKIGQLKKEEMSYICLARSKKEGLRAFEFNAKMLDFGLSQNFEIRL